MFFAGLCYLPYDYDSRLVLQLLQYSDTMLTCKRSPRSASLQAKIRKIPFILNVFWCITPKFCVFCVLLDRFLVSLVIPWAIFTTKQSSKFPLRSHWNHYIDQWLKCTAILSNFTIPNLIHDLTNFNQEICYDLFRHSWSAQINQENCIYIYMNVYGYMK